MNKIIANFPDKYILMQTHCFSAIESGDLHKVNKLLEIGLNPNIIDKKDDSCLSVAIRYGYLDIIKTLISHGANFKENKNTLFEEAVLYKHMDVIDFFLENGINLQQHKSILMKPLATCHLNVFQHLIEKGANIYSNGHEALIWCARNPGSSLDFISYVYDLYEDKSFAKDLIRLHNKNNHFLKNWLDVVELKENLETDLSLEKIEPINKSNKMKV